MRDLKADLELCNRASGESWKQASDTGYPYTIMDETFENVMAVYCTGDDAQFIAQAREGWPHAIERAIKAETLVLELREALNKIAYPARYLQNEADKKNLSLDGRVATELANSSHWLKSIAKEVLGDEPSNDCRLI